MRCEDVQAHVPDHLARALPPATADAVRAHLAGCPACAAEFEAAEDTWQRLGVVPPPAADSAGMRARFEAALAAHQQEGIAPSSAFGRRSHVGLQFAAAAAMLILGVALGRATVPGAPPAAVDPQIAEMRTELRQMREMVTLSLLQQQSASERLKGITLTSQIDQPGRDVTAALIDALKHDPNVSVRLVSIDALRRFAEYEAVRRGAIEALPQQTSPLVQIALIDFIVELDGREAVETLRRLSADPMLEDAVRARAARGAEQLG